MKLTEYRLDETDVHPLYVAEIQQILKNQMKAEKLDICTEHYVKNRKIVNRLKKRIEEIHTYKSVRDETELKKELQKILDGAK